nr:complement C1q tumor necrosis factor-related protein 3 isoform X2 [Crassostrea gigas]
MATIALVVVLILFVLDVYGSTSDDTCRERLDNLEKLLANLNEKFKNDQTDNTKVDVMFKIIQDENSYLKSRLKSLEEIVLTSNRRTEKLEAKIADLESSNWFLKSRLKTANTDYRLDKKYSSALLGNLKTNDSRKENTTTGSYTTNGNDMKIQHQTAMVKRKISQLENKPSISKERRPPTGIRSTSFPDGAAFSAYVSVYETDISKDFTIHFDTIITNIGNHYNKHTGAFTAPQHGVYVFTWNLYCNWGGYIYSQLVVNSNVVGTMFTSAEGATDIRSHTGIVVVKVNQGDIVFVRAHPTIGHSGNLYSHQDWRSSFNGWKLY